MKNAAGISFRPTLLPTLLTLVLAPLLAALGFWQLDRAEQKKQVQRLFAAGAESVVDLRGELLPLPRYQRVRARGQFDGTHQFLLDNMLYRGVPGFHVLSIIEVQGSARRLLVNRGWIPAAADRSLLPTPVLPSGEQVLTGRLDMLPRPGLKLRGTAGEENPRWPRLVVFPDLRELEAMLPYRLYPMVLLLDDNEPDGFRREWSPVNFGPERHIAYAVQWFALSATLLVIFVVVNIHKGGKT